MSRGIEGWDPTKAADQDKGYGALIGTKQANGGILLSLDPGSVGAGGSGSAGSGNTVAATAPGTSATSANPVQGVTGGVPMPVAIVSGGSTLGLTGTQDARSFVGTNTAITSNAQTISLGSITTGKTFYLSWVSFTGDAPNGAVIQIQINGTTVLSLNLANNLPYIAAPYLITGASGQAIQLVCGLNAQGSPYNLNYVVNGIEQ